MTIFERMGTVLHGCSYLLIYLDGFSIKHSLLTFIFDQRRDKAMNKTGAQQVEKWLLYLVLVQLLALIIAQLTMSHLAVAPYLNRAIRYEGVYEAKPSRSMDTIQHRSYMWYDKKDRQKE